MLAAILLVGAVALAMLLPSPTTLLQALQAVFAVSPDRLQHAITAAFGRFAWTSLAQPLLVRQVWLLPVSLGLICIGGAVTTLGPAAPRTKHRRS